MLRRNLPIDLIAEMPGVFRCPIEVPRTLRSRYRGIKGVPPGYGVLLATSAVNSIGLEQPLTALALDEAGRVLATHAFSPNTIWRYPAANWILELPHEIDAAPAGRAVRLVAIRQD